MAARTRHSVCIRKMRYASAAAALDAARIADLVLRPYRCDRCRHYHLTSRTKGKWVPGVRTLEPADALEAPEDEA
ncbi:hypothetical protein [Sphingopyxis sp.]|uniref:hypothetical protein n=1 Tax=Sphingopyxis sp. TaxID=1908224 RepID=UPI003D0D3E08